MRTKGVHKLTIGKPLEVRMAASVEGWIWKLESGIEKPEVWKWR